MRGLGASTLLFLVGGQFQLCNQHTFFCVVDGLVALDTLTPFLSADVPNLAVRVCHPHSVLPLGIAIGVSLLGQERLEATLCLRWFLVRLFFPETLVGVGCQEKIIIYLQVGVDTVDRGDR